MLVLFIVIMIYVVQVAEQAKSIKDSELQVRDTALTKLVVAKDPGHADYNLKQILDSGKSNWQESQQRVYFTPDKKGVKGTFSDLTEVFPIATCPHPGCKKFIPRYYFRNNVSCPACGIALADIPARPKERRRVITENDHDGDGMPNSYETSKGFDPNWPDDQLADADRDGFSNLYEYENNTDPTIARNRPPLWYRLRYITMESVVLPIKFRSISTQNQLKNKKRWILQFTRPTFNRRGQLIMDGNKPRETSEDRFIGDVIEIEQVQYKIVDAVYDLRRRGKDNYSDHSTVRLEQVVAKDSKIKPDVLIMAANKEVRSNDKRLILEDVGTPILKEGAETKDNGRRKFVVKPGQRLSIGNRTIGVEEYRLRKVDEKAKTALLERPSVTTGDATKDAGGKKMLITRDSEIPEDLQVKNVRPRQKNDARIMRRDRR